MGTKHKPKRLSKRTKSLIFGAAAAAVLVAALLITNIFIPVKYLFTYFVHGEERRPGVLTVTYLDVGYGDCTLVELPDGKVMLIDGGDGAYPHNVSIFNALNRRSVDKIDFLVCSSVYSEYCGGLEEVIKYKDVGTIYLPCIKNPYISQAYTSFLQAAQASPATKIYSAYGQSYIGEDYFFTFLSPSSPSDPQSYYNLLNSSASEENMLNVSAVLWLEYAGTSFVFTSSAGSAALSGVVEQYKTFTSTGAEYGPAAQGCPVVLENCNIVSVPGHGREECTSATWYATLKPEVAVISVGDNYSGYPSAQAIADIGSSVASPILTSRHGNITVTVTTQGYTIT